MSCEHLIDGDGYCEECPATVRALHDRIALLDAACEAGARVINESIWPASDFWAKGNNHSLLGLLQQRLRATGHLKENEG